MKTIKSILLSVFLLSTIYTTGSLVQTEKVSAGYLNQNHLDNRVIFQNFSLFQPYEKNMYSILTKNVEKLKQWGVTDMWTAPAYRAFGMSRFKEGYAMTDRYDLGEFPQGINGERATKYGTSEDLKSMIQSFHQSGLNVQLDLVPNQMFGMDQRQYTTVTRVDSNGSLKYFNGAPSKIQNESYLAYTKGRFAGQQKYGVIKTWDKQHFIGTSLQNQGSRTFKDGTQNTGKPYYYRSTSDYYLPSELKTSAMLQKFASGQVNLVDGYLSIDGWLVGGDGVWRPILAYANHYEFNQYLSSRGYSRSQYYGLKSTGQLDLLNGFLQAKNYNMAGEQETLVNDSSGIDSDDQLMFSGKRVTNTLGYGGNGTSEFLIGLDVDYYNDEVKRDTENWVDFLLNNYHFDGFRIDAASHFDKSVLDMINTKVKGRGNNAIAYLESYGSQHKRYLESINGDMMAMNHDSFYTLNDTLGYLKAPHLANIFKYKNRYGTSTVSTDPNWSFVNNHDQEKNRINEIIKSLKGIGPGSKPSLYDVYTKELEAQALSIYFNDMERTDKKWAPHNVLSQYAYILGMKNTTPTVYYGDMYRGDKAYMSTPTIYHDGIVKMLEARKQFAKGEESQVIYNTGSDLVANVRFGTNKNEGMAVVIADNPNIDQTLSIYVGAEHAGQYYKDVLGRDTSKVRVDANGNMTIRVKGTSDQLVKGQVGMWVPDISKAPAPTPIDPTEPANPADFKFKLGEQVTLVRVPGMRTVDGKDVPEADKGQGGTVLEVLWMNHADSGLRDKTYKVQLNNGKVGYYVEHDLLLSSSPEAQPQYAYNLMDQVSFATYYGLRTVDGRAVASSDIGKKGVIIERSVMNHNDTHIATKTYRVHLSNGAEYLFAENDIQKVMDDFNVSPIMYVYNVNDAISIKNVFQRLTVDGKVMPASNLVKSGVILERFIMNRANTGALIKTYTVRLSDGTQYFISENTLITMIEQQGTQVQPQPEPIKPTNYLYKVNDRVMLSFNEGMVTVDGKEVPYSDYGMDGVVLEVLYMQSATSGVHEKTYKVRLDNGTIGLYVERDLYGY